MKSLQDSERVILIMPGDDNIFHSFQAISEKPSVALTFQSLCQFFSSVDPGALLDLPTSPTLVNYESKTFPVLISSDCLPTFG